MSVCRTVYLAAVGVRACRSVPISVLLMTVKIATEHGSQGPVLSSYLSIDLWMLCKGDHISTIEKLIYARKAFGYHFLSIV